MSRLPFVSAVLFLLLVASVSAALTDGVVEVWEFDLDGTDELGVYNLTPNGVPPYVAGKLGNATDLSSGKNWNATQFYNFTGKYGSIAYWIKTTATGWGMIYAEHGSACNSFYTNMQADGTVSFEANGGQKITAATINNGSWRHVVTTWNASAVVTYIDGSLASNWTGQAGASCTMLRQQVGFNNNPTTQYIVGQIDQMALWNRSLSASEVSTLYASGSGLAYVNWSAAPPPSNVTPPSWFSAPDDGAHINALSAILANCTYPGETTDVYLRMYGDASTPPTTVRYNSNNSGGFTPSVSDGGTYYYRAACYNSTTGVYSENTSIRSFVYDSSAPVIAFGSTNGFTVANRSVVSQYGSTFPYALNLTDNVGLYGVEVNVSRGGVQYNYSSNESLSGLQAWFNRTLSVASWPVGRYTIALAASDSHTADAISEMQVSKKKSTISFKSWNDNNVKIESRESSTITAEKEVDRYSFRILFDDGLTKARTFDVKTDRCPLRYIPESGFKAHFVSSCRVGEGGNWVDFEGVAGTPTVTRIDAYHYAVSFPSVPADVTFRSIGGLNLVYANYSWYRGNYSVTTPSVPRGETSALTLNLTTDGTQNFTVGVTANGSALSVTALADSNWTAYFAPVTFTVGGSYLVNWTVNVTQDTGENSSFNVSATLVVTNWTLGGCGAGMGVVRLNWTTANEDTPSDLLNGTFEVDVLYWPNSSNNTATLNYTFASASGFMLCSNLTTTLHADVYGHYAVAGTFTHRFILQNVTLPGAALNYSLYNFNSTEGVSQLRITTRHTEDYSYYVNVLIYLQRRYVGSGVWRTVQMERTGDYGLATFDIREISTDYKLLFYDAQNALFLSTDAIKFACSSTICDLTQLLSESSSAATSSNLTASYTYDNSTKVLTLNWSGPPTESSSVSLGVVKQLGTGETTVCSDVQVGSSGTLACNLSAYKGTFSLTVLEDGTSPVMGEWFTIKDAQLSDFLGKAEEAFWGFAIMVSIVFAGLFSPGGVIIFSVIGLIVLFFLGLVSPLTIGFIIVASAAGIILAAKVKV